MSETRRKIVYTLDEQMWLDRAELEAERRLAREHRRQAAQTDQTA